jgi:hypothetical protein
MHIHQASRLLEFAANSPRTTAGAKGFSGDNFEYAQPVADRHATGDFATR